MSVAKVSTLDLIAAWRKRIGWITLAEAIILLRRLGCFHVDKIIVCAGGYRHVIVEDLFHHFSGSEFCINIRPVYFDGGPTGGKQYKGTLITLLLDRILLMSHEKGAAFVLREVDYARSFGQERNLKKDATSNFTYSI